MSEMLGPKRLQQMEWRISELEREVDQLKTMMAELNPRIDEIIGSFKSTLSTLELVTQRLGDLGFEVEEIFRLINEVREMVEDSGRL